MIINPNVPQFPAQCRQLADDQQWISTTGENIAMSVGENRVPETQTRQLTRRLAITQQQRDIAQQQALQYWGREHGAEDWRAESLRYQNAELTRQIAALEHNVRDAEQRRRKKEEARVLSDMVMSAIRARHGAIMLAGELSNSLSEAARLLALNYPLQSQERGIAHPVVRNAVVREKLRNYEQDRRLGPVFYGLTERVYTDTALRCRLNVFGQQEEAAFHTLSTRRVEAYLLEPAS
jgi:septal ring factor EnvC (AmiA/AmiB activator)